MSGAPPAADAPAAAAGAGDVAAASVAPQPQRGESGAAALAVVAAAALSPSSPTHPDGLSLAGLRAFVAEHGGEAALAGKTTSDVKWEIVVPETKAAACSYANLLRARERGGVVGRANAFISHVYSERFLDVVEAIAAWEARQHAGGATPRRELHGHALEAALLSNRGCDVCRQVIVREATWHSCAACSYDECSACFAESERLAALPPEAAAAHAAEGSPPVFYYFDLLVVNQHGQSAAVASDVLWREFTGSVRAIGRTLVVLTLDAARKGPLTRPWCVAEIAAGLQGAVPDSGEGAGGGGGGGGGAATFEVIMTPSERAKFLRELTRDFDNITQRTCTVDLERAHAWHGDECLENGVCRDVAAGRVAACSNDLELVLAHVRREISFAEVNQRVISRMREFMVGEARAALAAVPGAEARAGSDLQFFLARFLDDCGRLAEAAALLHETAEARRCTQGAETQSTLAAISALASILKVQGKLGEAEPLHREALAVQRRTLGDAHPETLISLNNLGSLLYAQGKLGEAEALHREALEARQRTLGATHPTTLTSVTWLATLLQTQGKLSEAEPLYRVALAATRRTLGDSHYDTLSSINSLARLLADCGGASLAEAEALSREALAGRKRTLGDAHTHTLISLRDTANLLVSLGGAANLAEAALLDAEALAGLRGALGEAHLYTLGALRVHGRVLAAQGDLAGATAALRASLDGFRAQNAVEARRSARELAAVLRAQGDAAGAAEAEASVA